ncbi:MAG: precorrin-8X methylmutase, partial [Dehalococcoidales bacterium]|nr:precorrin-8X methylmutase [Dehalococcoidales bacterium]
ARGAGLIVIAPYFLFSGRHITEDIPQVIEGLKRSYPQTQFLLTESLGLDSHFIRLVARRIKEAVPALTPIAAAEPGSIEKESLSIVESQLPPLALSEAERAITKRIIHACGDVSIAPLVKFSPSAVLNGLKAISSGSPIFTDVHMVATGISENMAAMFGCRIACALDLDGVAPVDGKTRTSAAMTRLGEKLNGSIVAIGNAPTALLALLSLIDTKKVNPALVVGMPVGFVQAAESKQSLTESHVPYITVTGTRGGSPMAAAAINSLLRIAADKRKGQC